MKRMKYVLYNDTTGISKEVNWQGGGFFKYHTLEQYEDTLENIDFIDIGHKKLSEIMPDYIFYMLEWETRQKSGVLNVEKMQNPFDYKLKGLPQPKDGRNGGGPNRNLQLFVGLAYRPLRTKRTRRTPVPVGHGTKTAKSHRPMAQYERLGHLENGTIRLNRKAR